MCDLTCLPGQLACVMAVLIGCPGCVSMCGWTLVVSSKATCTMRITVPQLRIESLSLSHALLHP
jgi:hypothetical protein